jgi:hypothetical protein
VVGTAAAATVAAATAVARAVVGVARAAAASSAARRTTGPGSARRAAGAAAAGEKSAVDVLRGLAWPLRWADGVGCGPEAEAEPFAPFSPFPLPFFPCIPLVASSAYMSWLPGLPLAGGPVLYMNKRGTRTGRPVACCHAAVHLLDERRRTVTVLCPALFGVAGDLRRVLNGHLCSKRGLDVSHSFSCVQRGIRGNNPQLSLPTQRQKRELWGKVGIQCCVWSPP